MPRGPHKYIKRTGSPGNYRYWYKLPDGRVVEGDDAQQKKGRNDHARRLLAGRAAGLHGMSMDEISRQTGQNQRRLREHVSNMRQAGRRRTGGSGTTHEGKDMLHHGHEFDELHMKEAHEEIASSRYRDLVEEKEARAQAGPARRRRRAAPRRSQKDRNRAEIARIRQKLMQEHGVNLEEDLAPKQEEEAVPAPSPSRQRVRQARSRASGPSLRPIPGARTQSGERVPAPSEESQELAEQSPAFGAGERDIQKMVEDQAQGKNPYLKKAQKIFNRIKGDINTDRAGKVEHALSALQHEIDQGGDMSDSALLLKYKHLSGNTRVRTFPWGDVEKATFHTKDELMNNPPVNVEVERMKRGYAAKQLARALPFIKDSWKSANPSAPPPYPTFGDFKSWSEHGSRPAWAGSRSRIAVPKDIFDAAVKKNGKPQYPPAWMPIHLMPVWNYVAKKTQDQGQNPYATQAPSGEQVSPSVQLGARANFQEGMIISSLRKYVQMRGGAENLVDIPSNKLAEAGLTHEQVFKADQKELSDAQIKQLVTRKIIDPVEWLKVLKKDMPKSKRVKKSFVLKKALLRPTEFVIDAVKLRKERFYV